MSIFGVILVHIFPAFSHIWTQYGEILRICPYSVRMRENVAKMRKIIIPNMDIFYAVHICSSSILTSYMYQGKMIKKISINQSY